MLLLLHAAAAAVAYAEGLLPGFRVVVNDGPEGCECSSLPVHKYLPDSKHSVLTHSSCICANLSSCMHAQPLQSKHWYHT
jgi:hypothetical protein